jgi:hypothetical protein
VTEPEGGTNPAPSRPPPIYIPRHAAQETRRGQPQGPGALRFGAPARPMGAPADGRDAVPGPRGTRLSSRAHHPSWRHPRGRGWHSSRDLAHVSPRLERGQRLGEAVGRPGTPAGGRGGIGQAGVKTTEHARMLTRGDGDGSDITGARTSGLSERPRWPGVSGCCQHVMGQTDVQGGAS